MPTKKIKKSETKTSATEREGKDTRETTEVEVKIEQVLPEQEAPEVKEQKEVVTSPVTKRTRAKAEGKLKAWGTSSKTKKKTSKGVKTFILDTNVLLHDPTCLSKFEENNIIIPMMVLKELDHHKNGERYTSFAAREVIRQLRKIRKIPANKKGWKSLAEGLELVEPLGNCKFVNLVDQEMPAQIHKFDQSFSPDDYILGVALKEFQENSLTVLITKDLNLLLQADALGLPAEDYENDTIKDTTVLETPILDLPLEEEEILRKYQGYNNALFKSEEDGRLLRWNQQELIDVIRRPCMGILPKAENDEQAFALDVLLDPKITLVALTGNAGTGKTLLAIAAALAQKTSPALQVALQKKSKKKAKYAAKTGSEQENASSGFEQRYTKISIGRPTVPLSNKSEGFLPGSLQQKIEPYMEPVYTALDFIASQAKLASVDGKVYSREQMIAKYEIEIKALSTLRGVTLHNTFFIIDEAQNLTPHEVKSIVTRAGEGTKVVLLGDLSQIDTPYLNVYSSGLSYLVNKMTGASCFAHVKLQKVERSALAQVVIERLG